MELKPRLELPLYPKHTRKAISLLGNFIENKGSVLDLLEQPRLKYLTKSSKGVNKFILQHVIYHCLLDLKDVVSTVCLK